MTAPPYPPRPAPPLVLTGRILGFVALGLELVWLAVLVLGLAALFGVGLLSIMWGPPCTGDSCGPSPWPQLVVGLVGCAVGLTLLAISLPVAWRRPSLLIWSAVSIVIVVATAAWSISTFRSPF